MRLKRGRGYVSAERNFDEDLSLGYIPIDSVHTPVKKVNYTVEAARLGQNTEFDKLTIEVWTDGSVKPDDAIGLAAKLIKDHMSIFINFEEDTDEFAYAEHRAPAAAAQRRARPLGRRAGAVGSLVQLPEERQHPHHPRPRPAHRSARCSRRRTSARSP